MTCDFCRKETAKADFCQNCGHNPRLSNPKERCLCKKCLDMKRRYLEQDGRPFCPHCLERSYKNARLCHACKRPIARY